MSMEPNLVLANLDSPVAWIIIGLVALLIFGHKLPGLARSMGQSVSEFKKGVREGENDTAAPAQPAPPAITTQSAQPVPSAQVAQAAEKK